MNVPLHHEENATKHVEVVALPRLEGMLKKERDDRPDQIASLAHPVGCSIAMISPDDSASEECFQRMQQPDVAFVLHDGEFGKHLEVHPHVRMNGNPNMKTSFTVHETCDPFRLEL